MGERDATGGGARGRGGGCGHRGAGARSGVAVELLETVVTDTGIDDGSIWGRECGYGGVLWGKEEGETSCIEEWGGA